MMYDPHNNNAYKMSKPMSCFSALNHSWSELEMSNEMSWRDVVVMKSELYATPVFIGSHSAICPVCGVGSNFYPCYNEGGGPAAPHRMTYCGHLLEGNPFAHVALRGKKYWHNKVGYYCDDCSRLDNS